MKRIISLVLLLTLTAVLLSGCSDPEERAWQSGQKALAEENYSEAVAAFEQAGSFQDAERLLMYARAWEYLESGDYNPAAAVFHSLGDFKDSVLMDSYCRGREQEALMQTAISSGDADSAAAAGMAAYESYTALSLFRDSDTRAIECRDLLYSQAEEWMNTTQYEAAAATFAALGSWQDSAQLEKYCRAAALELQGSYKEAANLYAEIPGIRDSSERADAVLEQAYQAAMLQKEQGDYDAAAAAFAQLADYRDAAAQRDEATRLQILVLLQAGSFAKALDALCGLSETAAFPAMNPGEHPNLTAFLESFLNVWMNAHAGVMTSFFSCNLLQPYLEPGGELDTLLREELGDDSAPLNYGFVFLGSETGMLLMLDENFYAAQTTGKASFVSQEGYTETEETLWVLIDNSRGYPLAVAARPA